MLGIHDYWLFIASGILLNLTPGQDTIYILGRSLTGGLRAGVASAFGILTGSIIHTLPLAFTVVKLCGAAYLIYLGTRLLFTRSKRGLSPEAAPLRQRAAPPGQRSARACSPMC
jgi:threonine/homoserine/homoserine lactone efflux protein